jgi:hypothetical protein
MKEGERRELGIKQRMPLKLADAIRTLKSDEVLCKVLAGTSSRPPEVSTIEERRRAAQPRP